MAQTLYWVVVPASDSTYANNDTDAAKIVAGNRVGGTAATASGSETSPTTAGANTVDEQTPVTGLTTGTQYRIAWTIYDGVSAYGGGTTTKVVESIAFVALAPTLFTGSPAFYAATVGRGAVALTPGLFTGTPAFYTPTVGRGAVALTPTLFTGEPAFYAATVTQGTPLTASLFTGTPAFYAATVAPGAVALTPTLFSNAPVFYTASVTLANSPQTITATLFTGTPVFYAATALPGSVAVTPGLFTNTSAFYGPTVTQIVAPTLFTGTPAFYEPTVAPGAAPLTPSLFSNAPVFFGGTITGGAVVVTPTAPQGGGKARKTRRRYAVEVDGQEIIVSSPQEAEAILSDVRAKAEAAAEQAMKRAAASPRRKVRKVLADAKAALKVPEIVVPPELDAVAAIAQALQRDIGEIYRSAINTIEIGALLRRQQAQEEDDEDVLLLLL